MRLLLTSAGISNPSIRDALVDLLGKPIAECNALFIPTAIYPYPGGAVGAYQAISGKASSPLCQLGWKTLGLLELTALPSIAKSAWIPAVEQTDVLLVWGGDPLYLSHWMRQSGLAALLPTLRREVVYVGVSAGSMAVAATIAETYRARPECTHDVLKSEDLVFATPQGEIRRTLILGKGIGLVDFALIPHFENENFPDATTTNAEIWAARAPSPVYAIDDQTAIKVADGTVEVVSEGRWKLFSPSSAAP
jgi:dipeptidase E